MIELSAFRNGLLQQKKTDTWRINTETVLNKWQFSIEKSLMKYP